MPTLPPAISTATTTAATTTADAGGLAPGDWFQIIAKSHFAHGEIHQAKSIKRVGVRGYDSTLDLGVMVEFVIEDYFGRPCRHAVPLEWCRPAARPSLAKRVKESRRAITPDLHQL